MTLNIRQILPKCLYFLSLSSPANRHLEEMVELTGIEPVTPCLQSRCSPS